MENNNNNNSNPGGNSENSGYNPNFTYGQNANNAGPNPNNQGPDYNQRPPYGPPPPYPQKRPGTEMAVASLVLGCVSVFFSWIVGWILVWLNIVAIICGAVGIILASKAKKDGYFGPMLTAGQILSIIGLGGGCVILLSCSACIVCYSCFGYLMYY